MLQHNLPEAIDSIAAADEQHLLSEVCQFHDVRVYCETNHPALLVILHDMLRVFPLLEQEREAVTYRVLCHKQEEQFTALPPHRKRTDTIRLLTNTRLKYYRDTHNGRRYLKYEPLSGVNGAALSMIDANQHTALTQIEAPVEYQAQFLRRYVFLLTLGQLLHPFGFEPCHAGAVTAPWNDRLGALIVGDSGSGKTSLSVGCASAGCGLLSDDLIMLRQHPGDESIHAYAISHEVSLRSGTLDLWPGLQTLASLPPDGRDKRYCMIEQILPGASRLQTEIRLLLFPLLTSEAGSKIVPLTKAQTLQRLLDECLGKSTLPQQAQARLFSFLSTLAAQAPGYEVVTARGANDGPQLVSALFAGERP
jgi:hypothetical protein